MLASRVHPNLTRGVCTGGTHCLLALQSKSSNTEIKTRDGWIQYTGSSTEGLNANELRLAVRYGTIHTYYCSLVPAFTGKTATNNLP